MYWTDLGTPAVIEKASMDGSDRIAIVTSAILQPNGLTVDYATQTLYWTDGGLQKLESSQTDGSNRRVLTNQVLNPFSITVYANTLYWSDWRTKTISSAHLSDPITITNIHVSRQLPFGIQVVSESRQPLRKYKIINIPTYLLYF